jgi:hypothetical protein
MVKCVILGKSMIVQKSADILLRYSFRNYTQNEEIKIFHGVKNLINTEVQFFSSSKKKYNC